MRVQATAKGWYDRKIRVVGEIFTISKPAHLGSWMKPIDGVPAPAREPEPPVTVEVPAEVASMQASIQASADRTNAVTTGAADIDGNPTPPPPIPGTEELTDAQLIALPPENVVGLTPAQKRKRTMAIKASQE